HASHLQISDMCHYMPYFVARQSRCHNIRYMFTNVAMPKAPPKEKEINHFALRIVPRTCFKKGGSAGCKGNSSVQGAFGQEYWRYFKRNNAEMADLTQHTASFDF
ncbi:hypothetical protein LJC33_06320, partial [Eubacteriales bacterium OttesenSCG-928-N13]|nr:hypothetical protein [Eubacteriales bacterium OttesenSCG-928-N13]